MADCRQALCLKINTFWLSWGPPHDPRLRPLKIWRNGPQTRVCVCTSYKYFVLCLGVGGNSQTWRLWCLALGPKGFFKRKNTYLFCPWLVFSRVLRVKLSLSVCPCSFRPLKQARDDTHTFPGFSPCSFRPFKQARDDTHTHTHTFPRFSPCSPGP